MFDAIFNGLDVAEHHRGRRAEAEPVGHVHDFEPIVAHGFEGRDSLTDAIHENFAATAGNGAETRGFEIADNFLERLAEYFTEMDELAGTKTVDVDLGEASFDVG